MIDRAKALRGMEVNSTNSTVPKSHLIREQFVPYYDEPPIDLKEEAPLPDELDNPYVEVDLPIFIPQEALLAIPKVIGKAQPPKLKQSMAKVDQLSSVTWADLSTDSIEFVWNPWLVKGFLSLLVSRSGDGKSLLALRICGCFLMGLPWPDGTSFEGERGSVLWVETEAAQALNRSRAEKWGYPLDKILTPFDDPYQDANLDDIHQRKIIEAQAAQQEVKFIVIDSLSGGSKKRENDTEIKDITLWAAKLARDLNKPILLIHHLGKKKEWDMAEISLDRVRGSSSIVQFARVVWALSVPDPTNKDSKRLEQIKNNFTRFPEPIGMTAGENGIDFGEAPKVPHIETSSERVSDLLLSLLEDGPAKVSDIEAELDGVGLSMVTAKREKARLGIASIKKPDGWWWALSEMEIK
jgi:hypothetical protein